MVPKQSRLLLLNVIRGAGLNVPRARLAKVAPIPADADCVLADFTECDFDGYGSQTPPWGAPALDGGFVAYMQTGLVVWTAGALIAAPQTIYAVYVTYLDPTAGDTETLLFFERLTPTVTLVNPGETLTRTLKFGDTNF